MYNYHSTLSFFSPKRLALFGPTNSFSYTKAILVNRERPLVCILPRLHFVEKVDFHGTWTTLIGTFHQDQIVCIRDYKLSFNNLKNKM